ncbi:MAG: hypothetical protein EOP61_02270 [Sphingomonadales bacterium]|nr:MAG: hypothetical protein EOP61_02270 [Sphingomonadales bacterium]
MYMHLRNTVLSTCAVSALICAAPVQAKSQSFDIPAQAASSGVREFARQANVQVLAPQALLTGKRVKAVRGTMSVQQALTQMLSETGLGWTTLSSGAIVINVRRAAVRAPAPVAVAASQDVPAPANGVAADESQVVEETTIIVTGSRVARNGFQAPTPLTVLGADELQNMGVPNVAEGLNKLPALRATLTPSSSTSNSSYAGGNYLDLRGLGANRTLLLVDGRRFVSSIVEGPTDVNVIPQALIGSAEIVTGGASAAYGSDAVAGVVNLKLDHALRGFKATLQGGITDHADNRNFLGSIAFGTSFADGRGKLLLGGEAAQNSGVLSLLDRDWGRLERGIIANPAYTATNSEPRNLLVNNARRSNTSYGGVITSGPLAGIQFAPDGTAIPFRNGGLRTARTMQGGDGAFPNASSIIATPSNRQNAYARISYEVSPALALYAEGSWAESRATTVSTTREDTAIAVRIDNPFLPQSVRTAMTNANIAGFTMGRYNLDYGTGTYYLRNRTIRGLIGAGGEIGGGWKWDAYYIRGDTNNRRTGENVRNTANYNLAVDATTDVLTGAAVCRNVAARAAGCVPINLFGHGAPSQQALDYVTGDTSIRVGHFTQDSAALTIQGEPLHTWAGPVSLAFGAEYRRDAASVAVDALTAAGTYATGATVPWNGSVNVKEAFAELVVPLARDSSWAHAIDLNVAGRLTDYSTSGTVSTWKVGATWDITSQVRLRATLSRDIRAPSLAELFQGARQSRSDVFDPVVNQTYLTLISTQGDARLRPEKAQTFTAGLVLNDLPFRGLRASVDVYDIRMDDAIAAITFTSIVDRCYRDQPNLCALISRGANGLISQVQTSPQNLQSIQVRGVDFELGYTGDLGPGKIALRGIATYADRIRYDDGLVVTPLEGSILNPFDIGLNGQPRWRGIASATYTLDAATFYLGSNLIGAANINNTYTSKDLDKLRVAPIAYVDASFSYEVVRSETRSAELFVAVQNALDTAPPATGDDRGTSPTVYDVIGRVYTAGVRLKF